ncbi:MAG: polyisoprenoid-binding protein [Betaproteobacteria bacterium]|nr:MAG: polyisoprenoid-binding protein [Betaproteobacteria bacterium]
MRKILIGSMLAAAAPMCVAAPESYTLDPHHTFVHFAVDHNGFSTIWGRFDRSSGKFTFDRQAGSVALEVIVETASVTTGDSARGNRPRSRDEHLRSPDFFNATEFPRMTYKSRNAKLNGDVPLEIQGELTLLGVTRPVTLTVDRWKCAPHPVTKRPICGGNATGGLKRSEFGMKWGIPATGDEVKILVTFEALKD